MGENSAFATSKTALCAKGRDSNVQQGDIGLRLD